MVRSTQASPSPESSAVTRVSKPISVMPAMASVSSAAVTSDRTSPRAAARPSNSVRPPPMTPANRSSSAECRVGSAAISPTSPGRAARAAGVVRKTIERLTISRRSSGSDPVSGSSVAEPIGNTASCTRCALLGQRR